MTRFHAWAGLIAAITSSPASWSSPAQAEEPAKTGYHVTNTYKIGGDPGWDYITVDPDARRVYVTHYSTIEVLDADTGAVRGQIKGMNGARGIAIVKAIGKGFATNGKSDSVSVIDLATLEHQAEIKVGKKPDSIIYDSGTGRVLVNNGDSDELSVIDPKSGTVTGTVALGGGPEYLAADGKGTVWINLFSKNGFVTVDLTSMQVKTTTPLEGCKGAGSMAFDAANRRLFIGCHNRLLLAVDADTGAVVARLPIGEHPDAIIFDDDHRLIFASTGDGFVTIVRQLSADGYEIAGNVPTLRGAKTLGFDPKTGKLFSATVENVPPNATSQPAPLGKVAYQPGPFVVLEIGK